MASRWRHSGLVCILLTLALFPGQFACEPGHGQDRVQLGDSEGFKNPGDGGSLQHDPRAAGEDLLPAHGQDG